MEIKITSLLLISIEVHAKTGLAYVDKFLVLVCKFDLQSYIVCAKKHKTHFRCTKVHQT